MAAIYTILVLQAHILLYTLHITLHPYYYLKKCNITIVPLTTIIIVPLTIAFYLFISCLNFIISSNTISNSKLFNNMSL